MADTRKITIEIISKESETGNNQTGNAVDSSGNVDVDLSKLMHPIKSLESATLGKNVLVNQAYQQAKKAVSQAIDLSLNRYFTMKENYLAQNDYNNIKTSISKVSSLGTSVIGGALAGSEVGGVYGAVIGASISAVGWGVSEILSYQSKMSSYYQSLNASNYQTSFNRTRAGLTNDGKGTEN